MTPPSEELKRLVEAAADGGPLAYRSCGWPHGASFVWEVSVDGAPRFYLKQHNLPEKFARERRCYEQWLPKLAHRTPELVALFEDVPALLLTALPGVSAEEARLTPEQERAMHREAGRFQAALNALPHDDTEDTPLADDLANRLARWLGEALEGGSLNRDEAHWVETNFDARRVFRDTERVPVHRDFQPRNWMVDTSGATTHVGFFDFDHAAPYLWQLGIVKLWDRSWIGREDLEHAFWEGYGRWPAERGAEHEQWFQTCLLHAVGVLWWSQKNGDDEYGAHGRRVFERVRRATDRGAVQ